jgi:hypothetical protein
MHAICGLLFFDDFEFEDSYYADMERLKSGILDGVTWSLEALLARRFEKNSQAQKLWEAVPDCLKDIIKLCLTHDYRFFHLPLPTDIFPVMAIASHLSSNTGKMT